jgi:phosphoglycolate phosphatase-like HAD superfamily hydrolase
MVIVFDVDGTLIGGEEQDWPSFDAALFAEFGYHPDAEFWNGMEEITGRAIIRRVAEVTGRQFGDACEQRVRASYLTNLRRAAPFRGSVFTPKPGAREILELLRKTSIFGVAIATGDFAESSRFKLASAGLDVSGIPFASSSDAGVRSEIIECAVERARESVVDAVYVGDGPWDLRACMQLEIPFIGTGRRLDRLREAGAEFLVEDLHPATLLPLLNRLLKPG